MPISLSSLQSSMQPAIDAVGAEISLEEGMVIRDYRDTTASGRPLILIHSINAAPSAMELKPLFEDYRVRRPVYAPDLPGFGRSSRGDYGYSPAWFAQAISEYVAALELDTPELAPDIVALSLSGEFVARAIVEHSMPCHSLTLISPTGLSRRPPPNPESLKGLQKVLRTPLIGRGLFRALTSKPSIRFFLGKAFHESVPTEMVDYAWHTAHQPGAEFGPFAFLSMSLFTPDALSELYQRVQQPLLVLYDEDPNIDFDQLPTLLARDNVSAVRIAPTLGLPQWERRSETFQALETFFAENAGATGTV